MSHLAFQQGATVELEADFVVVGSGAGGATAAVTLARGGADVLVVEAGAWRDPEHLPHSAYGGMRDLMPDFGAAVTLGRASWPIVQGRGVGGTTLINSAICIRTPADLFDQWRMEHGVSGPEHRERIWAIQEQIEQDLWVTETPDDALGNNNARAIEGANNLGYESHRTFRYVKGCEASGQCLQGCSKGRKQSLNMNYVPEVLERGGQVLSCAPVHRLRIVGGRAVAAEGWFVHPKTRRRGARFVCRARQGVVVAASVVHSPLILRRSGLRMSALGRKFRAHPGTGIFGWYDDVVDMNSGATQGWASVAFREEPGFKLESLAIPAELVASRIKGGGPTLVQRLSESYRHLAMWCMAVRAESEGSVHRGPLGPIVRYQLDRPDMERMRAAAVELARTHFAAGARWVIPGVHGLPWRLGSDELHRIENASLDPRAWTGILSHLFGGCVQGSDPRHSVCDGSGRVHGVEGLVIGDASQIPTNLGVNPQHTIMALAQSNAEDMLRRASLRRAAK